MKRGFTLFEMIVAIGVFTIIVVISLGSVLTITNAQKKAVSFRAVQDNLNFALETMSKSIRVGYEYRCYYDDPDDGLGSLSDYSGGSFVCPTDSPLQARVGNVFLFTDPEGDTSAYRIVNGNIDVASSETGNVFAPLTSNDVEITQGWFYVRGEESGDGFQPMVTIVLTGVAGRQGKIQSEAKLQTTISQRRLDS